MAKVKVPDDKQAGVKAKALVILNANPTASASDVEIAVTAALKAEGTKLEPKVSKDRVGQIIKAIAVPPGKQDAITKKALEDRHDDKATVADIKKAIANALRADALQLSSTDTDAFVTKVMEKLNVPTAKRAAVKSKALATLGATPAGMGPIQDAVTAALKAEGVPGTGTPGRAEAESLLDEYLKKMPIPVPKAAAVKAKALEHLRQVDDGKTTLWTVEVSVGSALLEEGVEFNSALAGTELPVADQAKEQALMLQEALAPPPAPLGVIFADSNWGDGDHTTAFSMVVNPLTNETEMWQMNEDGTSPSRMDQDVWVKSEWGMMKDPDHMGAVV